MRALSHVFFFNPGPVRRVPIPNRYTAKAKLCFCKNNKRRIIIAPLVLAHTRKYAPLAKGKTRIRLKDWQKLAPLLQKELSGGAEATWKKVQAGRESVLFIGTQFSILYTFMYSPA